MVARGFRNDDTSVKPSASNGPILQKMLNGFFVRNSTARKDYDGLRGVPKMSDLQGCPGIQVAAFVLGVLQQAYPEEYPKPNLPNGISPTNILNGMCYTLVPDTGTTGRAMMFRSFSDNPLDPLRDGV